MTDTPKRPDEPAKSERPEANAEAAAAPADAPPAEEAVVPAEDVAEPSPPRSPPPAVSRAGAVSAAFLTTLLLLAVVAGVSYAAWPFWSPYVERYVQAIRPDAAPEPRLDDLAGRLAALENAPKGGADGDALADLEQARAEIGEQVAALLARVEGLEKNLEGVRSMVKATALPGEAADARRSLDELTERIARLEQSDTTARLQEGLERLDAERAQLSRSVAEVVRRVEGLEEKGSLAAGASESVRALVLAAGELREALRTSAPFEAELAALGRTAGDNQDLARLAADLAPHAATGIPVLATLDDRFRAAARRAMAADRQVEGDGWLKTAANRLASLVTIRRTSVSDGEDTVDAAIARAEAAMRGGDLIAAVRTLEGLDGAAAEAMAGGLQPARARILAERAMAVLHVQAVSLIAPSGQ